MQPKQLYGLLLLTASAIFIALSTYIVDQREQTLLLQFGEPIGVIDESGLKFKWPWQSVERFDRRLLLDDSPPNEVITKDKKTINVDSYTRWRINDPLRAYQTARTQEGVAARMQDVVRGKVREVLGQHTFSEIVSGGGEAKLRSELMAKIRDRADEGVKDYGIDVLDVRIMRADLPQENSDAVFERMKAERQRIAKEYRSEGEEAAREIRAAADKEQKVVLAEAYKRSQVIRGRAEAEANRIYAREYGRDPQFFAFLRSLEAYRASIGQGTQLVISPSSEFFRYFEAAK